MRRVGALARVRIIAYTRTQLVIGPLLATLALLAIAHANGPTPFNEDYGFGALLLLPIFAWQAKLALDTDPDPQRQLAILAVGSRMREIVAGMLAAGGTAIPTIGLGLATPWLTRSIEVTGSIPAALLFGLWTHLLAAAVGIVIGALSSRAVARSVGWAVLTLVSLTLAVLLFGLDAFGILGWLVPRLGSTVEIGGSGDIAAGLVVSIHALSWVALLLTGYGWLRRARA